ncbi:TolC family protein [Sphingobacterium litopenaei]|uniref:TolC family protein n=1 Tax=Sphingobacterium litopenaei TaxID=2763500 RepID=A0ABR7YHW4_9SPHI|nr:TolC family protein [Sphingobacterium litopenaei]MBD1430904.1 TolC family protein [Sphingobacterium litopenaei]
MKYRFKYLLPLLLCAVTGTSLAQTNSELGPNASLDDLITYALHNKIDLKQAQLDKEIGEKEIASALSGWFPQINATGSLGHAIQVPTVNIGGSEVQMAQKNTSALTFQAEQSIISPQLFQASKASRFIRERNDLNVESTKINTIVDVSKAYYDILTSEEQIKIINENITRLERQLTEATSRYEVGLVDKTDFKRAQISLNNAKASLKSALENRQYKYDFLKSLLNIPTQESVSLSFANQNMESNILLDTAEILQIANRVEFKQIQNLQEIQKLNTQYQKWNFLPKLNAYANYGLNYRNNEFSDLYSNNIPSSNIGLSLSVPIFQGGKRLHEIRKSELQEQRLELDLQNLENQISAQYSAAMASYRANMNEWRNAKGNMELSEEVYNTIKLQYDAGVKTYLELMTAETDLKTSQLNYLNALYAVLVSKLDIQKALGTVTSNN